MWKKYKQMRLHLTEKHQHFKRNIDYKSKTAQEIEETI